MTYVHKDGILLSYVKKIEKGLKMKIAIPVKTSNDDPAVSPLFGKAKFFAFVDGDKISIEKNEEQSGSAIVGKFIDKGIETVVVQHLGYSPFEMLQEAKIDVFYAGEGRVLLSEVLERFKKGELKSVDESNIENLVKHRNEKNRKHHS